ncbi:hypothetical protein AB3H15_003451 [Salmonella enterica]
MSTNEMTQAELAKSNAKIAKLIAETSKLNRESAWYPIVVATGLVGAVATITTVLLKLITIKPRQGLFYR